MGTTFTILTLLFIVASVALVLIILVQRPQGGGLANAFGGSSGGGSDTAFGGRTGDVLTVSTVTIFSIYLLLHMLNEGWAGSIMYPLVNVTVLVLSALIALLAFRERLSRVNWAGIGLAILAIGLIAWSENTAG